MDAVVNAVLQKFGVASIRPLSQYTADHPAGFITTGSFSVDWVIGRPGIPLGRIIEIFGPYSSGKSTIAASCLASIQQHGGCTILVDSEHSYTEEWATLLGVDPSRLFLMDPPHIAAMFEQIAFLCDQIIKKGVNVPTLIVIDSVSAFPTPEELQFLNEKDGDKDPSKAMGLHARYCAKGFRILSNLIWESKVAIICVSQLKDNPMMPFARSKLGGAAVDFHAAVQLQTARVGKDESCITVRLRCPKNKLAAPFRETHFNIIFNQGIDDSFTMLQAGVALQLIQPKGGGWCTYVPTGESFRVQDIVEKCGVEIITRVFPSLVPDAPQVAASQLPTETAPQQPVAISPPAGV